MDNASTIILGASCGALCIAGSYYFLNLGNSSGGKQSKGTNMIKDENDDKLFPAGKMFVYFGSQTGTAETFSRIVEKEGISKGSEQIDITTFRVLFIIEDHCIRGDICQSMRQLIQLSNLLQKDLPNILFNHTPMHTTLTGFNAKRVDLEDFNPTQLAECKLAVFLMATYGEGEHTDNATTFSNWMKNENEEDRSSFLKNISFTVFGLGNRQYEHFNQMGKRTNEALHKYGGKRVFKYGEGDDDGTLEDDFENWKTAMWPSLIDQFHPDAKAAREKDTSSEEKPVRLAYRLIPAGNPRLITASKHTPNKPFFQAKVATITANTELRAVAENSEDVGSTRCIEFDLVGTGLSYQTADNLAVLPENDEMSVIALAKALGFPLNQPYELEHIVENGDESVDEFPCPFTARDALTRFFDIHGLSRSSTLVQLIPYIADPAQKDWLRNLVSKDNRAAFKNYIDGSGKTIFELLTNELSSCKIPLEDFMHIIPHMQPRYYTISSSSSCYPDSVHITASVTEMSFISGKTSKGLCSSYLQGLIPNKSTCRIYVRPSTFKLPKQTTTPIIMIGPGTGIAPMRALLQERNFQGKDNNGGKNTLYFGCKNRNMDYLYRSEIEGYVSSKVLTSLHLAFSREQQEKIYVQQLIKNQVNGADLVADLDNGGHLYVCGGTTMGADVMEAIIEAISTHKKITKSEATLYVKQLQQNGKYVQELWSIA